VNIKLSDDKRQVILDTAYLLFRNQGFDATSMSEITSMVGGSKATIYKYFRSKEAIFIECLMAAAEEHITNIIDLLNNSDSDRHAMLRNFGVSFLSFVTSSHHVAVQRLLIAEAGRFNIGKLFFIKLKALRVHVEAFLSQLMNAGTIRSDDPQLAAIHLRALLEAEIVEPLLFQARDDLPGETEILLAAERAITVFLRAYAPD
jgi:Transcriptional regulator